MSDREAAGRGCASASSVQARASESRVQTHAQCRDSECEWCAQDDEEGGRRRRARLEDDDADLPMDDGGGMAWFQDAAGSDEDAEDLDLLKRAAQRHALGESQGQEVR
jgi:hypothetical protein